MVLLNNPIDRQQVATLARRIYPSKSAIFMKRFEQATPRPYGYLIIVLNPDIKEQDILHNDIFDILRSEEKKKRQTRQRQIRQTIFVGGEYVRRPGKCQC